ncbi:MAG: hypothetical protein LJE93_11290 [Acidobacteria bacterium]|nr:hypothetical protein [Acidobacteriota bacterium]
MTAFKRGPPARQRRAADEVGSVDECVHSENETTEGACRGRRPRRAGTRKR